jgi:hypothetical protein
MEMVTLEMALSKDQANIWIQRRQEHFREKPRWTCEAMFKDRARLSFLHLCYRKESQTGEVAVKMGVTQK